MPRNNPYILMVVPSLPEQGGGGVVQAIGYFSQAWQSLDDVPPMRFVVTRGRGSIFLAPLYLFRALLVVAFECGRGRVALVHVNVASRGSTWRKLAIVAIASLCRVPIVLHLHGGGYRLFVAGLPGFGVRLVAWMFRRARRIVVLGRDWQDFAHEHLLVPEEKISIVPNGVPDPVQGQLRRIDGGAKLLFMGRFSPEKGLSDLIEAMSLDDLNDLSWTAVIAGEGEIAAADRERLRPLMVDRVRMPGWLSPQGAKEAYEEANIFVLPSYLEGLSIALLEAMAHGMAVVATPVGAHPDVIRHGENGLLVPAGDVPALAAALRRLIDDEELRHELGQSARVSFVAEYQISRTTEQLRAVYDQVRG